MPATPNLLLDHRHHHATFACYHFLITLPWLGRVRLHSPCDKSVAACPYHAAITWRDRCLWDHLPLPAKRHLLLNYIPLNRYSSSGMRLRETHCIPTLTFQRPSCIPSRALHLLLQFSMARGGWQRPVFDGLLFHTCCLPTCFHRHHYLYSPSCPYITCLPRLPSCFPELFASLCIDHHLQVQPGFVLPHSHTACLSANATCYKRWFTYHPCPWAGCMWTTQDSPPPPPADPPEYSASRGLVRRDEPHSLPISCGPTYQPRTVRAPCCTAALTARLRFATHLRTTPLPPAAHRYHPTTPTPLSCGLLFVVLSPPPAFSSIPAYLPYPLGHLAHAHRTAAHVWLAGTPLYASPLPAVSPLLTTILLLLQKRHSRRGTSDNSPLPVEHVGGSLLPSVLVRFDSVLVDVTTSHTAPTPKYNLTFISDGPDDTRAAHGFVLDNLLSLHTHAFARPLPTRTPHFVPHTRTPCHHGAFTHAPTPHPRASTILNRLYTLPARGLCYTHIPHSTRSSFSLLHTFTNTRTTLPHPACRTADRTCRDLPTGRANRRTWRTTTDQLDFARRCGMVQLPGLATTIQLRAQHRATHRTTTCGFATTNGRTIAYAGHRPHLLPAVTRSSALSKPTHTTCRWLPAFPIPVAGGYPA